MKLLDHLSVRRNLVVLGLILIFLFLSLFRCFEFIEVAGYDFALKLRQALVNSDTKSLPLVFINIDDSTLQAFGQFPLPRHIYAQMLKILSQLGAKYVVFDIMFPEESNPEEDAVFAKEMALYGKVMLPYSIYQDMEGNFRRVSILPVFASLAMRTGFITSDADIDGKRRYLILRRQHKGKFYYHLAFLSALEYFGVNPAALVNTRNGIQFRCITKFGLRKYFVPLYKGNRLYLDFPGKWKDEYNKVSLVRLFSIYKKYTSQKKLTAQERRVIDSIRNSVCFVGLTATGTCDLAPTPLERATPMVQIYGVVFNSVFRNRFIWRLPVFFSMLGALSFSLLYIIPVGGLFSLWVMWFIFSLVWLVFNLAIFVILGWWIDFVSPLMLGILLTMIRSGVLYIENFARRQRVEQELMLASEIQRKILPSQLPNVKGIKLDVFFAPAVFVAGDFYDVWNDKEGVFVFLGDVSGKGVSAALYVSQIIMTERVLRSRYKGVDIAKFLEEINRALVRFKISGMFATATMIFIDSEKILVSDAGHLSIWIYRRNSETIDKIKSGEGIPLGVDRWAEYNCVKVDWQYGDVLFAFTDGFVEARLEGGEFIDERKIEKWIVDHIDERLCSIDVLVDNFYQSDEQSDDVTVLMVKNLGFAEDKNEDSSD